MAIPTKAPQKPTAPAAQPAQATAPANVIDIGKLTPDQLKALQKQLKEAKKSNIGPSKERFAIVDRMLREKAPDGTHAHTTRDIVNALDEAKLTDHNQEKWDQLEIKKVQARKQFLEKRRDKAGQLIDAPGTFGYKATEGGFGMTPVRIHDWFSNPANVLKLTSGQRASILSKLAA